MNNARWMAPFFNMGRRRRFFGRNRNNNRGMMGMVLTLVGIGAGAAWYGMSQGRNQNEERQQPLQNMQNMFTNNTERVSTPETAFADELLPESD